MGLEGVGVRISKKTEARDLSLPLEDWAGSQTSILPAIRHAGTYTFRCESADSDPVRKEFVRKHQCGELTEYFPQLDVCFLTDVFVEPHGTFLGRSRKGRSLVRYFDAGRTTSAKAEAVALPDFDKPVLELQTAISFIGPSQVSLGAMVTDILPALWMIDQVKAREGESVSVVLPANAAPIIRTMLSLLGVSRESIVETNLGKEVLFVRRLIYPSALCRNQWVHPSFNEVADWGLQRIYDPTSSTLPRSERIYFSPPRNAAGQSVSNCENEPELSRILEEEYGFVSIQPTGNLLGSQILQLNAASVIVGELSPRLFLSVFGQSSADVIAVRNAWDQNMIQSGLCRARGQVFRNIFAVNEDSGGGDKRQQFDICVDEFRRTLDRAIG